MTHQEILTKAIEKAITGGWEPYPAVLEAATIIKLLGINSKPESYYSLIFNHDFAKALWGQNRFSTEKVGIAYGMLTEPWQYHLQMMVIDPSPLDYLGAHI